MRIACIGSRALSPERLESCERIGEILVGRGMELHSGNAVGADQAYARGGSRVDPTRVHLHLPWSSYNLQAVVKGNKVYVLDSLGDQDLEFYERVASAYHPRLKQLRPGARKLLIRNCSILFPPPDRRPVDLCIAFPEGESGGTQHGIRICRGEGIPLLDLRQVQNGFMA